MKHNKLNNSDLGRFFYNVASTYCEAICVDGNWPNSVNQFGRNVSVLPTQDLSVLFGLGLTGQRVSCYVDATEVENQLKTFQNFQRNKVPMAIVVKDGYQLNASFLEQGFIVFQLENNKDLHHWMVLAQAIAEKALTPVFLNLVSHHIPTENPSLQPNQVQQILPNPDGFIESSNPTQKLIFGNQRKPVPSWQNLDVPVGSNTLKSNQFNTYEIVSNNEFYRIDYQEIINLKIRQVNEVFFASLNIVEQVVEPKAKLALIGPFSTDLNTLKTEISKTLKDRFSLFRVRQLSPFPNKYFEEHKHLQKVGVLEHVSQNGFIFKQLAQTQFAKLELHNFLFQDFNFEDKLISCFHYLQKVQGFRTSVYLDVPLVYEISKYPKHQLLFQNLLRLFPNLKGRSLSSATVPEGSKEFVIPAHIQTLKDAGPLYSRVSRFFQDTSIFKEQLPSEFVADPFQGLPVSPIATSSLGKLYHPDGLIPNTKLSACTGCLACLPDCPHVAIKANLFTLEDLLKEVIQKARKRGAVIKLAVAQMKPLVDAAYSYIHDKQGKNLNNLGSILKPAIDATLLKLAADEEKQNALSEEFKIILSPYFSIEIAITEKHFWEAESAKEGTGQLFALGLDSNVCTNCGICAERCNEGAIYQTDKPNANKSQFNLLQLLPDTSGETILKLTEDEEVDPFAALFLSDFFNETLLGGQLDDEHAIAQTLVHQTLAVAEEIQQSRVQQHLQNISKISLELSGLIKKQLSAALPTAHLESLMDVVSQHQEARLTADKIFADWGNVEGFKVVNKAELEDGLMLLDQLNKIKLLWQEGPSGIGKARYTVVWGKGFDWAARYPNNFIKAPSVYDGQNPLTTAIGLFYGHLRGLLDNVKVVRRAQLVANKKYKPEIHDTQLAGLTWEDLTQEEKQNIPPIFVFCSGTTNANHLSKIIESKLPIKLIKLNNGAIDTRFMGSSIKENISPQILLNTNLSAFVGRIYISNKKLLFNSLINVIKSNSAAIEVVAPDIFNLESSPLRWPELYPLMLNARGLIEFTYNPNIPEKSIGEQLNLEANPDFNQPWRSTTLTYLKDDVEQQLVYEVTWADWAFLHESLKSHFTILESKPNMVQVSRFIASGNDWSKQIPVVYRVDANQQLKCYAVSRKIVEAVELVQSHVQLFQELGGLYTKFPEKLKKQVKAELAEQYEIDLKSAQEKLAQEKKTWEESHTLELRDSITEKLIELSKMGEQL